jgi:excisionase family DNA binding protein
MAQTSFYRPPERPQTPPLALRPRQAAETLAVSISTLERLTRSGEIASVMIGRCRIYEVSVLERFLHSRRQSPEGGGE